MKKLLPKRFFQLSLLILSIFLFGAFTFYLIDEELNRDDINAAAKIMGLEFSTSEIDTMLPGLRSNLRSYEALREKKIDNGLSPSISFDPLPIAYQLPQNQEPIKYSPLTGIKRPSNDGDLAWLTVKELAELIQTRQISSVELTKFFLNRLKKHDPELECVITLTEALALEQANKRDEELEAGLYRGLLHGIPYGAKDLLAAKGYKTTWGAAPYKNQVLDVDASVIRKLEEAGAVLVAKLTLGALAWGDVWYGGKTKNPWDTSRGSSGSSAGSASAVAAGLVPFAIGTETLGSIVSPSTVCGTTGLRPTYGRVSRYGAMALSWTMDKIGPITRSVEDAAIVFEAIEGDDELDKHLIDAPFNVDFQRPAPKIRLGYLKSSFDRNYPFKKQDSLTLLKLKELGYDLIPIELPPLPPIRFVLNVEAAAAFDELTRSGDDDLMVRQITNAWPNVFRTARFVPAVEYIQANRLRGQLIEEMNEVFDEVDMYVHPSWASPSLSITNFTGHPCVVIPNGFQEDGRPTSITFTGKLFEEGILMELVKTYQDATDFHKKHPKLE